MCQFLPNPRKWKLGLATGLQKIGPKEPGGFGQNIFGRTKGNFNSWQIGHNSQQIGQPHSRLDNLTADWTNCPADGTNFLEDRT